MNKKILILIPAVFVFLLSSISYSDDETIIEQMLIKRIKSVQKMMDVIKKVKINNKEVKLIDDSCNLQILVSAKTNYDDVHIIGNCDFVKRDIKDDDMYCLSNYSIEVKSEVDDRNNLYYIMNLDPFRYCVKSYKNKDIKLDKKTIEVNYD